MKSASARFIEQLQRPSKKEAIAVIDGDRRLSYGEFCHKIDQLIAGFELLNLKKGDCILASLPNSLEFMLLYFAAAFNGNTLIPMNPQLPEADKAYIVELTQPAKIFSNITDLIFADTKKPSVWRCEENAYSFIFFTSGTTAQPKGVCHALDRMILNAEAFNSLMGVTELQVMLHVMPMGYMAGFLNTILCPLVAGGCVVLAPQFSRVSLLKFWDIAIKSSVNALWITPTMAATLARVSRGEAVSQWTKNHLKHVMVGTAPLPKRVKESFEQRFGVTCFESYGMTEVLLVSSNTLLTQKKEQSVGSLLKGIEIKVDGNELWVASCYQMLGYFDPEQKICNQLEPGFFPTGDIGYLDNEQVLFITDRKKDLIIHGGTNVSPRAVEEVIRTFDGVQDVAVVGRKHDFWSEEVIAFVVLESWATISANKLLDQCKQRLGPDAVPAEIKFLEELPKSSTGKVQKNVLKEMV